MSYDILIAGVGGQGTVLASRLIAAAAMRQGLFVRTAETIGMAQRGGCVVSHVRVDSATKSSLIPFQSADLVIGFEPAEAVRNLPRLKESGNCIVGMQIVTPVTASLLGMAYDVAAVVRALRERHAVLVDAYGLAMQAGSAKATNTVLLGAAIAQGFLPFGLEDVEAVIRQDVPPKFMDLNLRALSLGYASTV